MMIMMVAIIISHWDGLASYGWNGFFFFFLHSNHLNSMIRVDNKDTQHGPLDVVQCLQAATIKE